MIKHLLLSKLRQRKNPRRKLKVLKKKQNLPANQTTVMGNPKRKQSP
jgi:hypothetical protein